MKYGILIYDPREKENWRGGTLDLERGLVTRSYTPKFGTRNFIEFETEEKFLEWIKFNPTLNFRAITFNDIVVEHSLSISEQ